MTTTRITITLPEALLAEADAKLAQPGEGHSGMMRRLVEEALRGRAKEGKVAQYIRGWTEQPESDEETAFFEASLGSLAGQADH